MQLSRAWDVVLEGLCKQTEFLGTNTKITFDEQSQELLKIEATKAAIYTLSVVGDYLVHLMVGMHPWPLQPKNSK